MKNTGRSFSLLSAKMKLKNLQIMALFFIQLILFMPMSMVSALQITHKANPAGFINETNAVIEWQTDEPAAAIVNYGTTKDVRQNATRLEYDRVNQVMLDDLSPNTRYYFQLISITEQGDYQLDNNKGQFYSFLTTREQDSIPPVISNVTLLSITGSTATIRWETDEPSTSKIFLGEEGGDLNLSKSFPELVTDHIISIPTEEGEKYDYIVSSCDRHNNCFNSSRFFILGGADLTPPEINVDLPEWHFANRIDINGTTEPYSKVDLIVNGNVVRRIQPQTTGDKGIIRFVDAALPLSTNNITIFATDQVGNNASKDFVVKVDPFPPGLQVSGLPKVTNQQSATLTINVTEPVTVFFETNVKGDADPEKVVNVREKTISQTIVEIEWDASDETDVEEYAVYRMSEEEDLKRIGVSKTNSYRDTKIQPGNSYTYRVSAVDKGCNEGAYSNTFRADVPEGASVAAGTLEINPVQLTCEKKTDKVEHDGGQFTHQISFQEGVNEVVIRARDRAGHIVVYRNQTIYDMNPPEILEHNLAELSPTYIPHVTVIGRVSEPSSVIISVNGDVVSTEKTDDEGNFQIPVELSRGRVAPQGFSLGLGVESGAEAGGAGTAWINNISIVAVDLTGSQSTPATQEIVYTTCGYGSWFKVDIGGQPGSVYGTEGLTPNELTPRLMIDGNEVISFNVDLEYVGGYDYNIDTVSVRKYLPHESMRSEYDVDWVSEPRVLCNPQNKSSCYVQMTVKVPEDYFPPDDEMTLYEKSENLSTNHCTKVKDGICEKTDCLVPGRGCVKVPMMLEITFREVRPKTGLSAQNEFEGQSTSATLIQKQCWDLELDVQPRVPPDMIPEDLLNFSVHFLNATITAMDAVLEPLNNIKEWVFYTCMASWAVRFWKQFRYNFACQDTGDNSTPAEVLIGGVTKTMDVFQGGSFNIEYAKVGVCEIEYANDDESRDNCLSCQTAIKNKDTWERRMRLVCDRLFCPAAPTFQKYIEDNAKKAPKEVVSSQGGVYYSGSSCACVPSGNPDQCVPAEDATRVSTNFDAIKQYYEWYKQEQGKTYSEDVAALEGCEGPHTAKPKCCGSEYMFEWGSACGIGDETLYSEIKESLCLSAQSTNQPAEIEGLSLDASGGTDGTVQCSRSIFNSDSGFCDPEGKTAPDPLPTGLLIKQEYLDRYGSDDKKLYFAIFPIEGGVEGYDVWLGYVTSRVTFQNRNQTADQDDEDFYSLGTELGFAKFPDGDVSRAFTEEMRKKGEEERTSPESFLGPLRTYSRTGLERGRADELYNEILDKIGDPDKEYVVDPTADFWISMRCLCLTAVTAQIQLWRNVFTAIMNCFNTILLTGDGSAGVCQAVLEQYICDLIFNAIRCASSKYSSGPSRGGSAGGEIGDFFGALTKSGSDVSDSVQGRYGSSQLWESMFVEQKLIHGVCLFIFTGTWDIDVSAMLGGEFGGVPVESQALLTPCTRRFISPNPFSKPEGLTTWLYHMGVGLVAGADVTYNLKLICDEGYTCSEADNFEKGQCDCRSGKKEVMVTDPALSGTVSQGSTLNEEIYFTLESRDVRYNRAVLEYSWTDNQGEVQTRQEECDIGLTGQGAPAFCSFDIAHGAFRCSLGLDTENWARFNDVTVEYPFGQPVFKLGDRIDFEIDVQQAIPETDECNDRHCEYTKYLGVVIKDPNQNIILNTTEFKILDTRGQSFYSLSDFTTRTANGFRGARIATPEDYNTIMSSSNTPETSGAGCFESGISGVGLMKGYSVSGEEVGGSLINNLCAGVTLNLNGATTQPTQQFVLVIDNEGSDAGYKIFKPLNVVEINSNPEPGINNNFYKVHGTQGSSTLNQRIEFDSQASVDLGNGIRATLEGTPQVSYAEILFTVSRGSSSSYVSDETPCQQADTYNEAKSKNWIAEFTLYKSTKFGNRYEPSTELETGSGIEYPNPKSVIFHVLCSESIEQAAGFTQEGVCDMRSRTEQEECWCSEITVQDARYDAENTPFDCGMATTGKFCVDNKCGNMPACEKNVSAGYIPLALSSGIYSQCICAFENNGNPITCDEGLACDYANKQCVEPRCAVNPNAPVSSDCTCYNGDTPGDECDAEANQACYNDGTCRTPECVIDFDKPISFDCECGESVCSSSAGEVCGLNSLEEQTRRYPLDLLNDLYSSQNTNCFTNPLCPDWPAQINSSHLGNSQTCSCVKTDAGSMQDVNQCSADEYCCASTGRCLTQTQKDQGLCPSADLGPSLSAFTVDNRNAQINQQERIITYSGEVGSADQDSSFTMRFQVNNPGAAVAVRITGPNVPEGMYLTQESHEGIVELRVPTTLSTAGTRLPYMINLTDSTNPGSSVIYTLYVDVAGVSQQPIFRFQNMYEFDDASNPILIRSENDGKYALRPGSSYKFVFEIENYGREYDIIAVPIGEGFSGNLEIQDRGDNFVVVDMPERQTEFTLQLILIDEQNRNIPAFRVRKSFVINTEGSIKQPEVTAILSGSSPYLRGDIIDISCEVYDQDSDINNFDLVIPDEDQVTMVVGEGSLRSDTLGFYEQGTAQLRINQDGTFVVGCTATDNAGNSVTNTTTIRTQGRPFNIIYGTDTIDPHPDNTARPRNPDGSVMAYYHTVPFRYVFSCSAEQINSMPGAYRIDFGDGTKSRIYNEPIENIEHTYTQPNRRFTTYCEAQDSNGNWHKSGGFYFSGKPKCGNGVVDSGEICDPGIGTHSKLAREQDARLNFDYTRQLGFGDIYQYVVLNYGNQEYNFERFCETVFGEDYDEYIAVNFRSPCERCEEVWISVDCYDVGAFTESGVQSAYAKLFDRSLNFVKNPLVYDRQ